MRSLALLLFVGWVCTNCAPDLPSRTCENDSDCEFPYVCGPSGFCVEDSAQPDVDTDPAIDAFLDVPTDSDVEEDLDTADADNQDAPDLACEPGLSFCDGRQIYQCNEDGNGVTQVESCDVPNERCRNADCVGCEGYDSPCETNDDCQGEVVCLAGPLQCNDDGRCVTTLLPGDLGDPCWGDSECGDEAPFCYEPGDACQSGLAGDPCEMEDDCETGWMCVTHAGGSTVCSAGILESPCDSDAHCQSPLVCGPEDECQQGVVNDLCDNEAHCSATLFCGPSGYCQRGEEGDDCEPDDDCLTADSCQTDEVCDGLRCNSLELCFDGSFGDPCGDANDCLNPMVCGPHGCHPGDEGDPCETDTHCQSALRCALGECHAPDGAPCNDDEDCGDGYDYCGPIGCQGGEEGDPCNFDDDCDDSAGTFCTTNRTCQYGLAGDACLIDDDCALCTCVDNQCGEGTPFEHWRDLGLFEPCDYFTAPEPVDCTTEGMAYESGASTWRRTDEPVEIPLVNGMIDRSVVGYWPLDGDKEVISEHEITAEFGEIDTRPMPTWGVFGDADGALEFDGTDDYLNINDLQFENEGTICVWMRMNTTGQEIRFGQQGDSQITLVWNASYDTFQLDCTLPTGSFYGDALFSEMDDLAWHHYCVAWNTHCVGSTCNEPPDMVVYVDGRFQPLNVTPSVGHDLSALYTDWYVGAYNGDEPARLDGALDELIFFNRMLTPAEVAAYVHSGEPYGTSMVPDAQDDFDDVRITEEKADASPVRITHQIVGPYPHSNSELALEDIIAYWRLDGDGNTLPDETGDHNATNVGAVSTTGRFGDAAGAMSFDGSTYIDTGYSTVFGATAHFTIELWARADVPVEEEMTLFGYQIGLTEALYLQLDTDGAVTVKIAAFDMPILEFGWDNEDDMRDGRWHHYALVAHTCDGDVTRCLTLYVDGIPGQEHVELVGISLTGARTSYLGALNYQNSAIDHLTGAIDDVIIHDVARSADYIYNRANPGVPTVRFLVSTETGLDSDGHYPYRTYRLHWGNVDAELIPPLVPDPAGGDPCEGVYSTCNGYMGWWRFNEGFGVDAMDSSANRNHGELFSVTDRPIWVNGAENTALEFDPLHNEGVRIEHDAALANTGDLEMTIEAAISVQLLELDGFVLSKRGTDTFINHEYSLVLRSEFEAECVSLIYPGGQEWGTLGQPGLDAFTGTVRCTNNSELSGVTVYLDESSATSASTELPGNENLDGPLWIGRSVDIEILGFDGVIDSVRLMNRVLEEHEFLHYPLSDWQWGDVNDHTMCVPPPGAAGASCDRHIDCQSLVCTDGACVGGGE